MIETHVLNATLDSRLKLEIPFKILTFVNGLVAPSFLFCAGFAFAISFHVALSSEEVATFSVLVTSGAAAGIRLISCAGADNRSDDVAFVSGSDAAVSEFGVVAGPLPVGDEAGLLPTMGAVSTPLGASTEAGSGVGNDCAAWGVCCNC